MNRGGESTLREVSGVRPDRFRHTIPKVFDAIVGRSEELSLLREALATSRLVSLVGTSGVGKTRLAIELATRTTADVLFVRLAPLVEPGLVLQTVADTAALEQASDRPLIEQLGEHLAGGQVLIILDNFEHVVSATPDVVELLDVCPDVSVVITSRVTLRVAGEHVVELDGLQVPQRADAVGPHPPTRDDALALLARVARRNDPGFKISPDNVAQLIEICAALDGLPLALELAGSRLRLLGAADMVRHLGRRLDLLRSSARDAVDRQQTMRSAIEWSVGLLSASQRETFGTCSVFAGSFALDDLAVVADCDPLAVLDDLEALVDHHLLRTTNGDGAHRFSMLLTLREFAAAMLAEDGRLQSVQRAHAGWITLRITVAAEKLRMSTVGLDELDQRTEDVRAALDWMLTNGDPVGALRLASARWRYWSLRGHAGEGRTWLTRALAAVSLDSGIELAAGYRAMAELADAQGDRGESMEWWHRSEAMYLGIGDELGAATCWNGMALIANLAGQFDQAREFATKSFEVFAKFGDERGCTICLDRLATIAYFVGDLDEAARCWELVAERLSGGDDPASVAIVQSNLSSVYVGTGDLDRALGAATQAVRGHEQLAFSSNLVLAEVQLAEVLVARGEYDAAEATLDTVDGQNASMGDRRVDAEVAFQRAMIAQGRGDAVAAITGFDQAARLFVIVGQQIDAARPLERLALLADRLGQHALYVALDASAQRARGDSSSQRPTAELNAARDRALAAVGDAGVLDAQSRGAQWTIEDALRAGRVLGDTAARLGQVPAMKPGAPAALAALGLTRREAEVVALLVAERLSDREIAERLFISRRTATTHVSSVLRKLDISSRRDIVAALGARGVDVTRLPIT